MLKEKRPDIEIVGDELHPLLKITDFSPYVAKIKASGADSVITGNWGQDIALLLKAAADAGLQTDWYTYYAGGAGGPTAIKADGAVASRLRNRGSDSKLQSRGVTEMGGGVSAPRRASASSIRARSTRCACSRRRSTRPNPTIPRLLPAHSKA